MIRPYKDVAEFLKENSLSIGDILCYKTKNDDSVKHVIFAGYSVMTNAVCLGSEWLSLDELADRFFISLDDGQTFKYAGIIEQGPNVTFKVGSTYNAGAHSFKVTARYCDDHKNWLVLDNQDVREILVDDEGVETERYLLNHSMPAIDIPMNQWHNIIVKEPAALLEIKEGPYRPLSSEEVKM